MSNINTSILPVFKSEWQSQLDALKAINESTARAVLNLEKEVVNNSSLKPQLERAQLSQWEAAQKYNSFIESGRQLMKVASDAETRLKSTNLSLLERSQLESTRDLMINLASEFVTFKTQNGASLENLHKMDIGPKTYYSDGRVEWNPLTRDGLAGQVADQMWAGAQDVFARMMALLRNGPFTTEENYAGCKSLLSGGLAALAGKMLKNPGAGIPDMVYGEVLSDAISAADPAGVMCRRVYPKGLSPQELWRLGQVIEVTDPTYGEFTVVLIPPEELRTAALHAAFTDPQVQGLWSSAQATDAINTLTGQNWTPFLDAPDTMSDISALAPVWSNPQWGIQLASAGGIESDAGNGLYLGDLGSSIYGLADGVLKARVGEDGAGILLGNETADDLKFGSGSIWELTGTVLKVTANDQTTTRNWLAEDVFQTDVFNAGSSQPSSQSLDMGAVSYNLLDTAQNNDASYKLWQLNQDNALSDNAWHSFTEQSSNFLVDYSLGGASSINVGLQIPANWLDPIGAFYDSQSAAYDSATSIADKTLRIVSNTGEGGVLNFV